MILGIHISFNEAMVITLTLRKNWKKYNNDPSMERKTLLYTIKNIPHYALRITFQSNHLKNVTQPAGHACKVVISLIHKQNTERHFERT